MSLVLNNLLKVFKPYLESGANEIAISNEKKVFIDRNGDWSLEINEALNTSFLTNFAIELANSRGVLFDKKHPTLSTSLPNTNYRVQILHSSILNNQDIQINIRIPNNTVFGIESFALAKDLKYGYEDLKQFVRDRKNILINGGTGSGKTSLLNSLLKEVDIKERIVIIEDSPEIYIKNHNKTQILVNKNDDGKFNYIDGINSAMRLSPQRLILGELDTRNTLPFLRLNNTGHKGNISTLHANSAKDTLGAITINASFHYQISKDVLQEYIMQGVDYIIQISKIEGKRVICEVIKYEK
ncbi:MAG: Flp pilus assembly complex ATPase component TadA [Sulfurospirillum sp.]|nr:Flp pilus assembly complex ATPase component TadA [Sulfurospirillum sp.]